MAGEMNQLSSTAIGAAILDGDLQGLRRAILHPDNNAIHLDNKDNSYLHLVATMHRPFMIHIVVAAGVDLNLQNKDGNTALHVTALHHEVATLADLLMHGIDVSITNKEGKTAADIAANNTFWMSTYNRFQPGLRDAVKQQDVEAVEKRLRCWCAVDTIQDGLDVRQIAAAASRHDIVAMIDKVRPSLDAFYAVLECNLKKLRRILTRMMYSDVDLNYLQQVEGGHRRHVLQYALILGDAKMVDLLLQHGADVNTRVEIKHLVQGPLYFDLMISPVMEERRLQEKVIRRADLTLKDEKGRSAMVYAIDRTSGQTTTDLVTYFLEHGINVAERDDTGCSARNVAMLGRRHDIIKLIDKHLVELIRDNDVASLRQMAQEGYEDFFITHEHRDMWIYAAGNETDDVTEFLDFIQKYLEQYKVFHSLVRQGDLERIQALFSEVEDQHMFLHSKDKGGRGPLISAIIHNHVHLVKWLLDREPILATTERDNCNRTPLHYACACEDATFRSILTTYGADHSLRDWQGQTPNGVISLREQGDCDLIERERKANYGLELELDCLAHYEELLRIICDDEKSIRHFEKVLKTLKHPVAKLYELFHPEGHPLVSRYDDLLLAAIDHGKVDIACKLIHLQHDMTHKNEYDGVWLTASERAEQLGLDKIMEYIVRKQTFALDKLVNRVTRTTQTQHPS